MNNTPSVNVSCTHYCFTKPNFSCPLCSENQTFKWYQLTQKMMAWLFKKILSNSSIQQNILALTRPKSHGPWTLLSSAAAHLYALPTSGPSLCGWTTVTYPLTPQAISAAGKTSSIQRRAAKVAGCVVFRISFLTILASKHFLAFGFNLWRDLLLPF
jgi:hypothetical protein